MPPVRTAKKNTASADAAPVTKRPKTMWLKTTPKGDKDVYFKSSERDWDGKYEDIIGTATRHIQFGYEFVLTDKHIDDILALSKPVLEKIWHFIFEYSDVSYGAKNSASGLTTEAVVRLARACPNLKKVQLQGAPGVGEDALHAFFENCPNLTYLELSGMSRGLRENPEQAPKLKKLILGEKEENKVFMKAMRALGKQRVNMTITLIWRFEEKKWGDWELTSYTTDYKKGRKYTPNSGSSWFPRY